MVLGMKKHRKVPRSKNKLLLHVPLHDVLMLTTGQCTKRSRTPNYVEISIPSRPHCNIIVILAMGIFKKDLQYIGKHAYPCKYIIHIGKVDTYIRITKIFCKAGLRSLQQHPCTLKTCFMHEKSTLNPRPHIKPYPRRTPK